MNAQIYNTEVEAKINLDSNYEFIEITTSAFNKSQLSQSLKYVFTVFRTNSETKNKSKNEQSGRVVLATGEKANLAKTTINLDTQDRIIILLLIYNQDEQVVGKDRVVINDNPSYNDPDAVSVVQDDQSDNQPKQIDSQDVASAGGDGIVLTGIVLEETKTKPGKDFYQMFYSQYLQNNINSEEIIKIKEVLGVGRNTRIEVFVGETLVFRFFAIPGIDYLQKMKDATMARVSLHLRRQKRDSKKIKRY